MPIPSLLHDFRKYERINKNPNANFIDLSDIEFITPTSLLPSINYAFTNSIEKYTPSYNTRDHLKRILGKDNNNQNMIPLKTLKLNYPEEIKHRIITAFGEDIINLIFPYRKLYEAYGGKDLFPYIIGEILSNVEQHSLANKMYTCSQKYPNIGYIDVGILDDGLTIPGSYEKSRVEFIGAEINPYDVKNDCEAIYRCLNGISTKEGFKRSLKKLEDDEEIENMDKIGHGINTSVRMITELLGGSMLIASREGICHLTPSKKKLIKAKNNSIIKGTLIVMRFKKANLTNEKFQEYLLYGSINDVDY